MMADKYSSYIELTPGYESVVNLNSDKDTAFWCRYIVNDDMVDAVRIISKCLRPENPTEDVRHLWMQGSYGTGKTYSAIVMKHLLADDYADIEPFMTKNHLFAQVKDNFLACRQKNKQYVAFRSGECKHLNTSSKLLFELEQSVRSLLAENGLQYTGSRSLLDAILSHVAKFRGALADSFDNGEYQQHWSTYSDFDSFYQDVQERKTKACMAAQDILQSMNIGLATDIKTFTAWLKDVYEGNPELNNTGSGLFIIWDEFTEYVQENDLDVIQQLSLFAKEIPFFMIYVVHKYPGVFENNVSSSTGKISARFHTLEIKNDEKTTLKLIGESIIPLEDKKNEWSEICDQLYQSLAAYSSDFMGDPDDDMSVNHLKNIFPIHPMTVNLVTKVTGIAASNRSLFEFLKSSEAEGFRCYIEHHGIDDWKWVTVDFLWDYYFVYNKGGKKDFTPLAEDALQHYLKCEHLLTDVEVHRVFKGAMLLLATIGTEAYMRGGRRKNTIQATQSTLCQCFAGALDPEKVTEHLQILGPGNLRLLALAEDSKEGCRIELPYLGSDDDLGTELAKIKKSHTVAKLMQGEGPFGAELTRQFIQDERHSSHRLEVSTCIADTQQVNNKFADLQKTIEKTNHKFGLLVIVPKKTEDIATYKALVETLCQNASSPRMMVVILRQLLEESTVGNWHNLQAQSSLAQNSGNTVNANNFKVESSEIISIWVGTALGKEMYLYCDDQFQLVHSNNNLIKVYENYLGKLFPAAPEQIFMTNTLYKNPSQIATYCAVVRLSQDTKDSSNPKHKNFNSQFENFVTAIKKEDRLFECSDMTELLTLNTTKQGKAITALAKLMEEETETGTVFLTDLWQKIQEQLGYYEKMPCSYLLGFIFRFYLGKFTWYDGNNSNKLDEDTVPQLVHAMITGKADGMKLAQESDTDKSLKLLAKDIFKLSEDQLGDIESCRKYLKVGISKAGFPLWAMKYLTEATYNGNKADLCEIIDKFHLFVLGQGNITQLTEEIVAIAKPKAKIYVPLLSSFFQDSALLAQGLKHFIYEKTPNIEDTCVKYKFSHESLIQTLVSCMEAEVWQWTEQRVGEVTQNLTNDLTLVGILREALDVPAESIDKVKDHLKQRFQAMTIPGCVYKSTSFPWKDTIEHLFSITDGKWMNASPEEKNTLLEDFKLNATEALGHMQFPTQVLKSFVETKGLGSFSEEDLKEILSALDKNKKAYLHTEADFLDKLRTIIDGLAFTKKASTLMALWKDKTNSDHVKDWSDKYNMNAVWLLPDYNTTFEVVARLSRNEKVGIPELDEVHEAISTADFSSLSNQATIENCFLSTVSSEKYFNLLNSHISELKERITKSGYSDCSKWHLSTKPIQDIVDKFIITDLKAEVSDEAKRKMEQMTETELREQLEKLLESSTEACLIVLDK